MTDDSDAGATDPEAPDAPGDGDAADEPVRTWLVERSYDSRNLITLIYATPDGERSLTRELSSTMLDRTAVTAARDVDPDDLAPVTDPETRERYATEAERVRENNGPDEEI